VEDKLGLEVGRLFKSFLISFNGDVDYTESMKRMVEDQTSTLVINYEHVLRHDLHLGQNIKLDYVRFQPFLNSALNLCMQELFPSFAISGQSPKEFFISFSGLPEKLRLRQLSADSIGELCSITGTVTRTSMVRPELVVGAFQCGNCNQIYPHVEQNFVYTVVRFIVNLARPMQ
jgi:DNA replication licensing factor MCM6